MSNYTYMVTNNINGKVYVGSHSWKNEGLDPDYYGSGTAITRAVKKYGKEHFQVEVLYYYDTVEECRADEERILTEYNVRDCPYSYNCKNGAVGWTSEDVKGENNPMYGRTGEKHPMYNKHHTEDAKRKMSEAKKGEKHPMYGKRGKDAPFYGKHLSEESRKKLSEANNYRKTPVVAIDKNGKIRMFLSQSECSRVLGIQLGNINKCLKGIRKSAGGYAFKYIEQLESGIYEGIL